MIWTVQTVIDVKDQMKFKVLLTNWWSLAFTTERERKSASNSLLRLVRKA
jgi:hypothetical protein